MMAIKYISLTKQDVYNVINYIDNYVNRYKNKHAKITSYAKNDNVNKHDNRDEVLALCIEKEQEV